MAHLPSSATVSSMEVAVSFCLIQACPSSLPNDRICWDLEWVTECSGVTSGVFQGRIFNGILECREFSSRAVKSIAMWVWLCFVRLLMTLAVRRAHQADRTLPRAAALISQDETLFRNWWSEDRAIASAVPQSLRRWGALHWPQLLVDVCFSGLGSVCRPGERCRTVSICRI